MFNWSAGPDQAIILPYFWVYWAFAIPLTFFVLSVWVLFMAWSELRRQKKPCEASKVKNWLFVREASTEIHSFQNTGPSKTSTLGVGSRKHERNPFKREDKS
jgi:hypothetical protein